MDFVARWALNEEAHAKRRREAALDAMSSQALGDLLTAMGWGMRGRGNKANRRAAILHLEGHKVAACIVDELGLVRLEPVGGEEC